MNYYNEFDPKIAAWLRQLIADGHIPAGEVDERSIEDVLPSDLAGFTQCHFFAGIGGWSHALDLAGWPRDQRVWTGSCPCQPFSAAGKGDGFADERHLWPAWQHLIAQCRPPVVFGEQVASKAVDAWIDLVHADMEGMGYAFGGIAFPSAGVGAPHIRDRTFWVADSGCIEREPFEGNGGVRTTDNGEIPATERLGFNCPPNRLGHTNGARLEGHAGDGGAEGREGSGRSVAEAGVSGGLADAMREQEHEKQQRPATSEGGRGSDQFSGRGVDDSGTNASPIHGFWRNADWLLCTDGKWRPVEPGTFPLVDGLPRSMVRGGNEGESFHPAEARAMRLKGYGNAINPHQAAEFICATVEAIAA